MESELETIKSAPANNDGPKIKELTKERDEAVADKWKLKDALIKSSEKREVRR